MIQDLSLTLKLEMERDRTFVMDDHTDGAVVNRLNPVGELLNVRNGSA